MALFKKATKSPAASASSAKPPVAPRGAAQAGAPRGVFVEKPQANVYTVMLVVSFFALLIGCLCLLGEMAQYDYDFKAAGARVPPEPPDNLPPADVPPVPQQPIQAAPAETMPPATPPAEQPPAAEPAATAAPDAAPADAAPADAAPADAAPPDAEPPTEPSTEEPAAAATN